MATTNKKINSNVDPSIRTMQSTFIDMSSIASSTTINTKVDPQFGSGSKKPLITPPIANIATITTPSQPDSPVSNVSMTRLINTLVQSYLSTYSGAVGSSYRANIADVANSVAYVNVTGKPSFATVATSGSYNDLLNVPSLASYATQSYVTTAISNLVDGAPAALDTLKELANSLANNSSYASTITSALAGKVDTSALASYATTTYVDDKATWANITGKPALFSGSYADLTNKPTIPADVSDLTDTTSLLGGGGGSASTGNITFSDTTMTSNNGDVKIHFSPSASPAVEFNFASNGTLTLPGGIVIQNNEVKNTGELSGEVQITTATTQGDTEKNWAFNHNGAGALIVPEGSSIQSKSNFNITATETGFIKFTNIVDFDTNSSVDDNQINIVNPEASILDLIDSTSANYVGGIGSIVRIVYGPFLSAVGTIIEAFADPGTPDPFTGLPRYQGRIDIVNTRNGDLLKEFSIEHSSTWKFGSDGNLTLPGEIVKLEVDDANPSGGLVVSVDTGTGTGSKSLYKFGRGGQFTSRSISLTNSSGVPVGTIVGDGLGPIIGAGAGKEVWVSTDGQHLWRFTANRDFVLPYGGGGIRSEGNINIDVNLTDSTLRRWQFGEDGKLALPNNGKIASGAGTAQVGSTTTISTDSNGGTGAGTPGVVDVAYDNTIIPTYYYPGGGAPNFTDSTITFANGDVRTITSIVATGGYIDITYDGTTTSSPEFPIILKTGNYEAATTAPEWTFGTNGNLTLPTNTSKINYANGTSILSGLGAGGSGIALTDISVGADNSASGGGDISYNNSTGVFTYTPPDLSGYLTSVPTTLDNSSAGDMDIMVYDGNIKYTSNVTIDVSSGNLKANLFIGNLTLPAGGDINMGATKQVSNDTAVTCPINVDTVIYTSTGSTQHTFKVLLLVEGVEDPMGTIMDTQSCEMMIAKSFRNDAVAGTVYGLVYTSTNPLATFSTRWNAISSRVEVLCRPTSTTNSVNVRSFVTELATTD